MLASYKDDRIIFFDGICILCNRAVDFLVRRDRKKKFRFASLQSEYSRNFLSQYRPDLLNLDSLALYDAGKIYVKSAAVLKIAKHLGLPWSFAAIFYCIPGPLRDWLYDYIARNRYKWFGKRESCRLPDGELRGPSLSS